MDQFNQSCGDEPPPPPYSEYILPQISSPHEDIIVSYYPLQKIRIFRHSNGNIRMKADLHNGLISGFVEFYNREEMVISKEIWENGRLREKIYEYEYHSNGILKKFTKYLNNKIETIQEFNFEGIEIKAIIYDEEKYIEIITEHSKKTECHYKENELVYKRETTPEYFEEMKIYSFSYNNIDIKTESLDNGGIYIYKVTYHPSDNKINEKINEISKHPTSRLRDIITEYETISYGMMLKGVKNGRWVEKTPVKIEKIGFLAETKEGHYKNGLYEGEWRCSYTSIDCLNLYYSRSSRHLMYYSGVGGFAGSFKEGKKHGVFIFYHFTKNNLHLNDPNRCYTYKSKGEYSEDKKVGPWVFISDDYRTITKVSYINDKREGICLIETPNSWYTQTGKYVNDKKDGLWTIRSNSYSADEIYKNDELIEKKLIRICG